MYGEKFIKITQDTKKVQGNFKTIFNREVAMQFKNSGILIEYPWVVIDVDDGKEVDVLADYLDAADYTYGLMYTTKGAHFWFKSEVPLVNSIKADTVIGVKVDVKSWGKTSMVKVRNDGEDREWIYQPPGEDIDYLPSWLTPVNFTPIDFTNIGRGERHDALLHTVFPLAGCGFSPDDIYETLMFINNYMTKSPLDEIDIRAMSLDNPELVDDCFYTQTFTPTGKPGKKVLNTNAIAHAIQKKSKLHMDDNSNLWVYDTKKRIYVLDSLYVETEIHKMLPNLSNNSRQEVLKKIILNMRINGSNIRELGKHEVVVNNGILDLLGGRLKPFDSNIFNTRILPVDWNPNVRPVAAVDNMFNNVTLEDGNLKQLLYQIFGYTLCNHCDYQKAFMFIGEGSNGKSIVLDLITTFVGSHNKSNVPLNHLKEPTRVSALINKYVNIGDDISAKLEETDNFKSVTAGMEINVKRLYENPFSTRLFTKLIFAANKLPVSKDKSDGFFRRWVIIPFNAKFTSKSKNFDPDIKSKVTTPRALEYILLNSVKAYQKLHKDKHFIEPKAVVDVLQEYRVDVDSVFAWLQLAKVPLDNKIVNDTFDQYRHWCSLNGYQYPVSLKSFKKEIPKHLGIKIKNTTRDGIQTYIWSFY